MVELSTVEKILRENEVKPHLDLSVSVPCPMKARFVNEYQRFEADYARDHGRDLFSFVPSVCGAHVEVEDTLRDVKRMREVDQLPDFQIGMASNSLLLSDYFDRFVKTGCFKEVIDRNACRFTSGDEFHDRYHAYNVLALAPDVILVDRKLLGDRPMPQSMADLLDPIYEGCLGLPGEHGKHDPSETDEERRKRISMRFLLDIDRRFGEDGLSALERNTKMTFRGPAAARLAGSRDPEAVPIYVSSSLFAMGAERRGSVDVVWPRDGAPAQPIVLMARKDFSPDNQPLLDWLRSETMGRMFIDNYMISTYPGIDNRLPDDAEVSWLGWDFFYDNDVEAIQARLGERFGSRGEAEEC